MDIPVFKMSSKSCSLVLLLMILTQYYVLADPKSNAQGVGAASEVGKETPSNRDSTEVPGDNRNQQFHQHSSPQAHKQPHQSQPPQSSNQNQGAKPEQGGAEPQSLTPDQEQKIHSHHQQQQQVPQHEHSGLPLGQSDTSDSRSDQEDSLPPQNDNLNNVAIEEPIEKDTEQESDDSDTFEAPETPSYRVPLDGEPLDGGSKVKLQQQPQQDRTSQLPEIPNAHVTPPILQSDEDDSFPQDDEEEEEPQREPTPEEIEGEKLFQAGEKLINSTYYKEYREAYLNFLQAAALNHQKSKEYVAFGHLFGDYLPQNITRAAELFQELADKGSPRAQMGLAFMYSAGFHYNSSQAKALVYSTFGALGGDAQAQMALGYRYYAGIGVESKCETALTYYRKVAGTVADSVTLAGGPVVQRIRLQEEAESQGTNNSPMLDDDLLQYYHFLADKGDQQAQVVLGTLYYQGGKGVQINHEQAYHYFSVAAESGSGHALGYLGKMHSEGSPVVKQSNNTAFEYFKKSSDKNNHIGQAGLGMMYLNGMGIEKDTSKAFRFFSLASDQGSVDGQLQMGIMYFSGIGVRKDYKMAVKYFTMASQNGHVLAFYNLAQMHATGTGVLRNCHTAVELFKNVAERGRWAEMMMEAHRMYHEGNVDTALVKYMFLAELGYEVAQSNVAYILDNGASSKFSGHETYQRALLQYSRAAAQGSTHARLKMGDYHYYGLGTVIDYESAASHYRMASEQQHNAQAMFNLGYMHEKGLGLKQDVHLAKRFYDMAAETSLDAHVPVTLALLKLGVFYGMDVFSKEFEGMSGILRMLDPIAYLGPQWDLYLASFFAILFGVIYFLRRMR